MLVLGGAVPGWEESSAGWEGEQCWVAGGAVRVGGGAVRRTRGALLPLRHALFRRPQGSARCHGAHCSPAGPAVRPRTVALLPSSARRRGGSAPSLGRCPSLGRTLATLPTHGNIDSSLGRKGTSRRTELSTRTRAGTHTYRHAAVPQPRDGQPAGHCGRDEEQGQCSRMACAAGALRATARSPGPHSCLQRARARVAPASCLQRARARVAPARLRGGGGNREPPLFLTRVLCPCGLSLGRLSARCVLTRNALACRRAPFRGRQILLRSGAHELHMLGGLLLTCAPSENMVRAWFQESV